MNHPCCSCNTHIRSISAYCKGCISTASTAAVTPMPDHVQNTARTSLRAALTVAQSQSAASNRAQHKNAMTIICIVLSISFLLLTCPLMAFNVAITMNFVDENTETARNISRYLTLLNMSSHVMNFWVYCVYWKEFRRRAIDLCTSLCCCCKA